ncbi:MAG: hypothetical protein QMD71_02055 [bacterium]|nr:hypothetical protein [bacterium]
MEREAKLKQLIGSIKGDEVRRIQRLREAIAINPNPKAIDIIASPGKEKLVKEELGEFEKEREELCLNLKRLLEKADSLNIKDFKKTLKKLKAKKNETEFKEMTKSILFEQQKLQKKVSIILLINHLG